MMAVPVSEAQDHVASKTVTTLPLPAPPLHVETVHISKTRARLNTPSREQHLAATNIPPHWPMATGMTPPSETKTLPHPPDLPPIPPEIFVAGAPSPPAIRSHPRPVHFYGYNFVRKSSASGLTAPGGQYGGSQSGFIVTWDILPPRRGQERPRLALLARGAIAHGDTSDREFAAGVRWHPLPRLPLSLSVERRFRPERPDANAAYVAGGTTLALPRAFRLDGYAQAGFVSGPSAGPFFDMSMLADRKITGVASGTVRAGAGLWGGGQSGTFRIDVGPAVRTDIAVAKAHLRLSADWRIRIAGEAAPASGPAMTLSTSF